MNPYNKPIRMPADQSMSVDYRIPKIQMGIGASKINTAYTFIPCDIALPEFVDITPVVLGSVSANGIALCTTTVVPEVASFTSLSIVTDLDAWAQNVAYNVGTLVKNPGADTAYVCVVAHTSTTGGTAAADWAVDLALGYWQALTTATFIKIAHTAAGSAKVAYFNYKITGYSNN